MLSATGSCRTAVRAVLADRGSAASAAAASIRSIAAPTIQRPQCAAISIPRPIQKKSGDAFAPPPIFDHELVLAQCVRNVVEGRVQLVADALHRGNGSNSDKRGDQAVLNRSRALRIFNQLQKLDHLRSPMKSNATLLRPVEVRRMTGISLIAVY